MTPKIDPCDSFRSWSGQREAMLQLTLAEADMFLRNDTSFKLASAIRPYFLGAQTNHQKTRLLCHHRELTCAQDPDQGGEVNEIRLYE